jgi:glycerol 3-phosphatase-2
MHAEAVARTSSSRPLVVGDRLDTDIEGANRADVPSLLVFTGVTDEADVVMAVDELRPAFIADDLGGLHHPHPSTRRDGDRWVCGGAVAEVVEGALAVSRDDSSAHRLDAVRAACAAAWTYGVRRLDPHAVRRELAGVLR